MSDAFARLLEKSSTQEDVRRAMETETGFDPALWSACAELGIQGVLVPEEFGGLGGGARELELLMERAGATLACLPLLSSAVLAVSAIAGSTDADAQARLLPALADGSLVGTVALTGPVGSWRADGVAVAARTDGDGWRLDGRAHFVTDAGSAGLILVAATTPDGHLALFELLSRDGLATEALRSFDRTQRLSHLAFDGVAARRLDGGGPDLFEHILSLARVALAGRQAGGARRIFDITIDYLRTRIQFGRPIGGFQALKHMAADLLIEVESAVSAARAAAAALADDRPDAGELVALASFACGDAFVRIAADAIQMHGGIGFTWEHPAHLYLRRARGDLMLFGTSDDARERFVTSLEQAA